MSSLDTEQRTSTAIYHKVYAYITSGNDILVFEHADFPDAGIQVPGGSVVEGETHSQAVLRETTEETGLEAEMLNLVKKLGATQTEERLETGEPIKMIRHFYHLTLKKRESEGWSHDERHHSKGGEPIRFQFSWMTFKQAQKELVESQKSFISLLFPR
ncbi:MAG: NUDIX domain-containing protein [Chloroflexota bacterium]